MNSIPNHDAMLLRGAESDPSFDDAVQDETNDILRDGDVLALLFPAIDEETENCSEARVHELLNNFLRACDDRIYWINRPLSEDMQRMFAEIATYARAAAATKAEQVVSDRIESAQNDADEARADAYEDRGE